MNSRPKWNLAVGILWVATLVAFSAWLAYDPSSHFLPHDWRPVVAFFGIVLPVHGFYFQWRQRTAAYMGEIFKNQLAACMDISKSLCSLTDFMTVAMFELSGPIASETRTKLKIEVAERVRGFSVLVNSYSTILPDKVAIQISDLHRPLGIWYGAILEIDGKDPAKAVLAQKAAHHWLEGAAAFSATMRVSLGLQTLGPQIDTLLRVGSIAPLERMKDHGGNQSP